MKETMIRKNPKVWRAVVKEMAEDNEEIIKIANQFLLSLQLKRGKATGMGIESALELLACLGVFLNEYEA